jgi:hypothetical protein
MNAVLSARDLKVLSLVSRFGWVREDNLAMYLGLDYKVKKDYILVKSVTNRLVRSGWLVKNKFLGDRACYCTLSKIGAKSYNVKVQITKSLVTIRHDDLVEELAMKFLLLGVQIKTELELKHERIGVKKISDFVLNDRVAIEVEITEKSKLRIKEIIKHYEKLLDGFIFDKVCYYSDKKRILSVVNSFIGNSYKNKFEFYYFESSIVSAQRFTPDVLVVSDDTSAAIDKLFNG